MRDVKNVRIMKTSCIQKHAFSQYLPRHVTSPSLVHVNGTTATNKIPRYLVYHHASGGLNKDNTGTTLTSATYHLITGSAMAVQAQKLTAVRATLQQFGTRAVLAPVKKMQSRVMHLKTALQSVLALVIERSETSIPRCLSIINKDLYK